TAQTFNQLGAQHGHSRAETDQTDAGADLHLAWSKDAGGSWQKPRDWAVTPCIMIILHNFASFRPLSCVNRCVRSHVFGGLSMATFLTRHPSGGWRYQRWIPEPLRPLLGGKKVSVRYIPSMSRRDAESQARKFASLDEEHWAALRKLSK